MSGENTPATEHHASRPGIVTYVFLAGLVLAYLVVANGESFKRFLGLD